MKQVSNLGFKLSRSEMKNISGGNAPTVCTITWANGTQSQMTVSGSGPSQQCAADYWCTGNNNCSNVDCAGTGAC